jgi:cysteine desulfurase/selenocysteine lyase
MLCEKTGAQLKVLPMTKNGDLNMSQFEVMLNEKSKLVMVNHVSNALGTINPIEFIIQKAHEVGAKVLVDGAQSSPHIKTDVQDIDVDFYTCSAHKICGPTGIGMLYGKLELLEALPPYQGGGEMIDQVSFEKTTYAGLPNKFEAGTPNICGGIAFGKAIEYMNNIGFDAIAAYERELLEYATAKLEELDNIIIYGTTTDKKTSVISFNFEGLHPYDVGTLADKMGIALRTGHHCAQPIMDFFKIPGTIRASFAFYNTKAEIDLMIEALNKVKTMLL